MNYIVIEMQTNAQGQTAIVTPAVYSDAVQAEAAFLEKCMYARLSGLPVHSVSLLDQEGKQIARKSFTTGG